jgi:CysZ protein
MAPLDLATAPAHQRFFCGFRHALGGVPFVFRSRRLVGLCAIPMAVQAAVFVAIVGVALHYFRRFFPATSAEWWQSAIWHLVLLALLAASILVSFVLAARLSSILCDPVCDLISEYSEALAAGRPVAPAAPWRRIPGNMLRELFAATVALIAFGLGSFLIWLLNFIPVLGVVLNAVLSLLWTWLYLAHEYFSRSLGRHGLGASARLGAIFSNMAVAAGFGAGAWLLLFVPLTCPFVEVGAARLHLKLAAHDLVPSRLPQDVRMQLRA